MLIPLFIISVYYHYSIEFIIAMFIIIIHELAHSIISIYYGIEIIEIELFPFGGVAKTGNFMKINPFTEIAISFVGPLSNFFMLLIAIILEYHFTFQGNILIFFAMTNLSIGLFNLLPILPLDGGRIIRAYISSKIGFKKATNIIIKLSKALCILLFIFGIYFGVRKDTYFFLCGVAIFLFLQSNKEKELIGYTTIYHIMTKKRQLLEKEYMEVKHLTALESININKIFHVLTTNKYHFVTVIDEEGKVLGDLSEIEILNAMIKYNNRMTLGSLIRELGSNR